MLRVLTVVVIFSGTILVWGKGKLMSKPSCSEVIEIDKEKTLAQLPKRIKKKQHQEALDLCKMQLEPNSWGAESLGDGHTKDNPKHCPLFVSQRIRLRNKGVETFNCNFVQKKGGANDRSKTRKEADNNYYKTVYSYELHTEAGTSDDGYAAQ